MTFSALPFRATTAQACQWLAQQTGSPWSLARLIEHGLTPSVWLDYDTGHAALLGDARGGYATPLRLAGDVRQLGDADDVRITLGDDNRQIVSKLRFLKTDLERLVRRLARPTTAS